MYIENSLKISFSDTWYKYINIMWHICIQIETGYRQTDRQTEQVLIQFKKTYFIIFALFFLCLKVSYFLRHLSQASYKPDSSTTNSLVLCNSTHLIFSISLKVVLNTSISCWSYLCSMQISCFLDFQDKVYLYQVNITGIIKSNC